MTKLCPRGKAAAKRKFKVYPSAYANAYASKICAGKIKDPSGVKRKDFRGPKPTGAKVGMAVTAGAQSGMGRLEKSGLTKAKKGKMMIMIAVGKPKKAKEGKFLSVPRGKEKISPGTPGPYKFKRQLPNPPKRKIGRTEKEKIIYGPKPNPAPKDNKKKRNILEIMDDVAETINAPFLRQYKNYSKGSSPKGVVSKVAKGLEKASRTHAGQAKTLRSLKLSRGGGAAIRGTNFKGVF